MAIEYDLREKPDLGKTGEKQPLYPRVKSKGTITYEKLAKQIADNTTFSEGEVLGFMGVLSNKMIDYINDGYSVELKDIGYFTASLTARPVMNKKEIRAESISVRGVNFRMKKGLKKRFTINLERASWGFNKSSEMSAEKRKKLVEEFLVENLFITRTQYSRLTYRLRSRALKDLNDWVKEGFLKTKGKRSTKVYLLAQKQEIRDTENIKSQD